MIAAGAHATCPAATKHTTATALSKPASSVFNALAAWMSLIPNSPNSASIMMPMAPPK